MYYIFNKSLKFRPDTSELSIINEAQSSVIISKPACRLLLALTRNAGCVIAREDLLRIVWEEYGYTPSNNNLYLAMSELRKAFFSLSNESDLLITVPKVGIKLEATVDCIEKKKNQHKAVDAEIRPVGEIKSPLMTSVKVKISLSLVLIFLSIAFLITKLKNNLPVVDSKDAYVFKYRECTIYSHTLSSGLVSNDEKFRSTIIEKLKEYNVSCDNIKKDVYFQMISRMHNLETGYFAGVCHNMGSADARKCQTFTEWLD